MMFRYALIAFVIAAAPVLGAADQPAFEPIAPPDPIPAAI